MMRRIDWFNSHEGIPEETLLNVALSLSMTFKPL